MTYEFNEEKKFMGFITFYQWSDFPLAAGAL